MRSEHPTPQIHATWLRPEERGDLPWRPLHDAFEFTLVSCFVSQTGWARLYESLVHAAANPDFRARIVFSAEGMGEGRRALVKAIERGISHSRFEDRVLAYIMDDRKHQLFHPKGYASRSSSHSRVVVGSANLTRGAMESHDELWCVIKDDRRAYSQFMSAVDALVARVKPINDQTMLTIERAFEPPPRPAAPPPHRTPAPNDKRRLLRDVESPSLDLFSFSPGNEYAEDPLHTVQAMFQQGLQIIRHDERHAVSLTISLRPFLKAKILPSPLKKTLRHGITYAQTHGSPNFKVPLIPSEKEDSLRSLNKALGNVIGRLSVDLVGLRWMPSDWTDAFQERWKICCEHFPLGDVSKWVYEHNDSIRSFFDTSTWAEAAGDIHVAPPCQWDCDAAEELLGSLDKVVRLAPELDDGLRTKVLRAIRDFCSRELDERLNPEFIASQVLLAGRIPRLPAVGIIDPETAIDILADLTMLGAVHAFRAAKAARMSSNGVAALLSLRFREIKRAGEVYRTASSWKQALTQVPALSPEAVRALLAESLREFLEWFDFDASNANWSTHIPSWDPSWLPDEED